MRLNIIIYRLPDSTSEAAVASGFNRTVVVAGVTAGLIILIMCVTGALLAFEPQILALRERHVHLC